MSKFYYSLGLMSGTSMDGVDASIIQSDGESKFKAISDKYFKYPKDIYEDLTKLKDKIVNSKDLKKFSKRIVVLENKITLFHAKAVNEILKKKKINIDLISFHGQTIYHNAKKKISLQLGNEKLLSKLTRQTVIYDFRKNDLINGGQGAPLTPIFHKILAKKLNIKNVTFINIGGIINETTISYNGYFTATDVGPGMCLIDKWVRNKFNKKYDDKGTIAKSGKINDKVFNKVFNTWMRNSSIQYKKSFDIKDFENFFNLHPELLKGLSFRDGAALLTEFTAKILTKKLLILSSNMKSSHKFILCGGGRKNNFLVKRIKKKLRIIKLIDDYGVNGDFVESQAFAYLGIRSYLKLPISFPHTTGVSKPCAGGKILKFKKL